MSVRLRTAAPRGLPRAVLPVVRSRRAGSAHAGDLSAPPARPHALVGTARHDLAVPTGLHMAGNGQVCDLCAGKGWIDDGPQAPKRETCPSCGGTGKP